MAGNSYQGLSDEDIAREEKFLADVPRFNWGAFFMAPIWGAAHGDWPCILFYPLWIFVDNLLFNAWLEPTAISVTLAVVTAVITAALMIGYARISSPRSAHRAADRGDTLEHYLKVEKGWAIGMAVIALAMLAFATYYNLTIRPYM
ncbi:MAG: viscotoxin-A3 [Eggerthellales bacterium]|nr:viscotoxin-A3 [Eggerthellales bacterium]